jgi:hypothetical protein
MSLNIWQRMNSAWPSGDTQENPDPVDDTPSLDQAVNLRLAQMYADAEDAIAADGDVLDADEFDPNVDELDASEAVEDWADGGGKFKFVLEADE